MKTLKGLKNDFDLFHIFISFYFNFVPFFLSVLIKNHLFYVFIVMFKIRKMLHALTGPRSPCPLWVRAPEQRATCLVQIAALARAG